MFLYELSGCGFKFHCSHLIISVTIRREIIVVIEITLCILTIKTFFTKILKSKKKKKALALPYCLGQEIEHNPCHNTLRLYNVLVLFWFATTFFGNSSQKVCKQILKLLVLPNFSGFLYSALHILSRIAVKRLT